MLSVLPHPSDVAKPVKTSLVRQGYQHSAALVTNDEREQWAVVRVLDAVSHLHHARRRRNDERAFVAAILARFDELEAIRATSG